MWDAVSIGRRGGLSKSPRKVEAARRNAKLGGAKGGRPPKLPPEPEGLNYESPDHAAYCAELLVKKNILPEQIGWTEPRLWKTLEQMGRRDLLARRKKYLSKLTPEEKRKHQLLRKTLASIGRRSPA